MAESQYPEGLVLDIQRMSTEDGPGLRTTVFLKGCPLRCEWCHNPESISSGVEIEYFADRCIGCVLCIENCSSGALSRGSGGIIRDTGKCISCLKCSENCPATAMRARGTRYTAEDLAAELLKDKAFFGDAGGITISGGEALFQPQFTAGLCSILKKAGVNVAVDTCGLCSWEAFEAVLPHTDIFLYDVKILDPAGHKLHTGADNRLILENLKKLAAAVGKENKRLWIRTPVIPGATDSEGNIRKIAEFIKENLNGTMERWELCAFNNLCTAKYGRFGIEWKYKEESLQTAERMEILRSEAISAGITAGNIFATGMTGK